jgi:hypothetical protein
MSNFILISVQVSNFIQTQSIEVGEGETGWRPTGMQAGRWRRSVACKLASAGGLAAPVEELEQGRWQLDDRSTGGMWTGGQIGAEWHPPSTGAASFDRLPDGLASGCSGCKCGGAWWWCAQLWARW